MLFWRFYKSFLQCRLWWLEEMFLLSMFKSGEISSTKDFQPIENAMRFCMVWCFHLTLFYLVKKWNSQDFTSQLYSATMHTVDKSFWTGWPNCWNSSPYRHTHQVSLLMSYPEKFKPFLTIVKCFVQWPCPNKDFFFMNEMAVEVKVKTTQNCQWHSHFMMIQAFDNYFIWRNMFLGKEQWTGAYGFFLKGKHFVF